MKPFYQRHLFFCTNQKEQGKCCGASSHASDMAAYAKEQLKTLKLYGPNLVRVSKSGCLGRCKLGPSLVVYPEGVWYRYNSAEDIDLIIKEHLIENRPVESLLMAQA